MVAGGAVGEESFRAIGVPLHRPPKLPGCEKHGDFFRIGRDLHPEGASDIRRHDAQRARILDQPGRCHVLLDGLAALRGRVERVAAGGRVEHAGGTASFDGRGGHPVDDEVETSHVRRAGECSVRRFAVAAFPVQRDVAGGERRARIGDRRQRFVVDCDKLGRIARFANRLRNDHRHRLADEAHAVFGQHRAQARGHRAPIAVSLRHAHLHRADARGAQVRCGKYSKHASRLAGLPGVDRNYARMHVRGAHENGVHRTGQDEVVDEAPGAGEQGVVFQALHRLTDAQLAGRVGNFGRCHGQVFYFGKKIAIVTARILDLRGIMFKKVSRGAASRAPTDRLRPSGRVPCGPAGKGARPAPAAGSPWRPRP